LNWRFCSGWNGHPLKTADNETGYDAQLSRLLETLCEAAIYEKRDAAKVEGRDAETLPIVPWQSIGGLIVA